MANFGASTPQLKAVKNWLDAYCTLDMKNVGPLISKKLPISSIPRDPHIPKETGGKHIERYRDMLSVVSKFEFTYHEVIEAPGKVVIHGESIATTISGITLPYEAVLIVTLAEEDGELKILHCKDFADPQKRSAFIGEAIKAAAQRMAV